MKELKKILKESINRIDPVLFACTLLLTFISILTIFGAVDNFGKRKLIMQIAMSIAGIVLTFIIANIDYHLIVDKLWIPMVIVSAALLAVTLIFGSTGENIETTNKSWLTIPIIGIPVQPSEFVKIALVCSFGKHLSLVKNRINRFMSILSLAIHAGLIVGLILLSGDLGVALVFIGFILIMLFCAGLSGWYFAGGVAVVGVASPLLWDRLAEYQKKRIIVGFNPELDPLDKGMQPLMSKQCIENGGIFGIGLMGKGTYEILPASHTDFMFATICEKFGFIGGILVVILLMVMVLRIISIARSCGDDYGFFMCVGIAAIIIIQTCENIGMCLAMLPVVGLTLPFLSCGGSSLVATYILIALVHSVKSHKARSTVDYRVR